MKYRLVGEEADIFMDITFLLGSVLNLELFSDGFLQQTGKLIPFEKAFFLLYNGEEKHFYPCAHIRCDSAFVEDYIERYAKVDYLVWQLCEGNFRVLIDSREIEWERRRDTDFYVNYLAPYTMAHRLSLNIVSHGNELLGVVMFFRSFMFGDFTQRDLEIAASLQKYLAQAVENSKRFEQLIRDESVNHRIYDSLEDVIVRLDHNCEIQFKNKPAERYLKELEQKGKLDSFLQELKEECSALRREYEHRGMFYEAGRRQIDELEKGLTLQIIQPHPLTPSQKIEFLLIVKKQPEGGQEEHKAGVDGRQAMHRGFVNALYRGYGLTRREAEIMSLALEGLNNNQIAKKLYISLSTVKSHFQHGYAKLNIANRNDLFVLYSEYFTSESFRSDFEKSVKEPLQKGGNSSCE